LKKYETLMDQLNAFADWKGYRYLDELGQDAVMEFRRAWEDADAGYKRGAVRADGRPLWSAQSVGTCRRNAKTLRGFFARAITRGWITANPTTVLRFPKATSTKTNGEVKYVSDEQLGAILTAIDGLPRMRDYNKLRLRALVLVMRWTGLRMSDAVVLRATSIAADVLRVRTKKASTDVQIPLHPSLVEALAALMPYDGGYYFWDRRTPSASPSTPQSNYGGLLAKVFAAARVECDQHHIPHMLRNSFAVGLLAAGVPLETVSLMLGHQSVQTTERYYADFSRGYMDRAEARVRALRRPCDCSCVATLDPAPLAESAASASGSAETQTHLARWQTTVGWCQRSDATRGRSRPG
jgi:integrase